MSGLEALAICMKALEYCAKDDPLAVTPDGEFDVSSANDWKKIMARETLRTIAERATDGEKEK